ncbi:MAG: SAM-dependent methyltransferase, partial [Campylobacteraceae bacterium]|nr:SAM-dependent methyltransferase [Campylobacteraceae bacterium]
MIKFSQYFNEWLYDKDAYYANYKIIGKEGDFYTSVSTSAFFGGSIAQDIINSIETNTLDTNTTIVEIGAHHGYLIADIIQFIYTLKPELLKTLNFIIVERFEELRNKQKEYLYESFGDEINLTFIKNIKDLKLEQAYIVANEIFDAFSPTLVYTKDNILQEAFVENHKITFKDTKDKELIDICKQEFITKGEVCLEYKNFISI